MASVSTPILIYNGGRQGGRAGQAKRAAALLPHKVVGRSLVAARNYQPTLRRLCHLLSRFIARYQAQLAAGMTSSQATALAAMLATLDQLIFELGNPEGV